MSMKLRTIFFTLCLTLLCVMTARANMVFQPRYITTSQGLTSNYVNAILQDWRGMIWIGSTGGLSLYDGYRIQHITNIPYGNEGRTMTPGVNGLIEDARNGLLWIKTSNFIFFCYDTKAGRAVDYTGCGDQTRTFREMVMGKDGTAWLYQDVNGVRKVQYKEGRFSVTDYTQDNKALPCNEARSVTLTEDGGAWLSTDNGITYVDPQGRATIKATGFKIRRCIAAVGKYIFFTSKNEVIIYDAKGSLRKTIAIPEAFGKINRVTGDIVDGYCAHAFTNSGTLCVDLKRMTLERSTWPDFTEGTVFGSPANCHVVITRSGDLSIVDRHGKLLLQKNIIKAEEITAHFKHSFSTTADSQGIIYIATNGKGLFTFNPADGTFQHYGAGDINSIVPTNNLYDMSADKEGNIWIATQGGGLVSLTPNSNNMGLYINENIAQMIHGIFPMDDGRFFVSSHDMNNYAYNTHSRTFEPLGKYAGRAYSYLKDSYGHQWIGTNDKGFYIDEKHYIKSDNDYRIEFVGCNFLIEDKNKRMWIGARDYGLKMIPVTREYSGNLNFTTFLDRNAGERSITDMKMDSKGRMWVATCGGLFMVDTNQKNITQLSFHSFTPANSPIPSYDIMSLCIAGNKVWCGIRGGGVVICSFGKDYAKMTDCVQLTNAQGLPSNNISSLQPDRQGNIWVGTESGMAVINASILSIQPQHFSQKINENYFSSSVSYLLPDGRMLFGTGGGLLEVSVSNPKTTPRNLPFKIHFTDLLANNRSIFLNPDDSINCQALINHGTVELDYERKDLTICFSTLLFGNTDATAYQYFLEGCDKTWQQITNDGSASYMQLTPGKYVFHVKALVNNVWTDEQTIDISILPPWWRTWWAYLMYICVCATAGWFIYQQMRDNYILRQNIKKEKQRAEMERQLTDYKIRFFTNISHEFRTPLTIIRGVMERLKQLNQQGNMKRPLDTMQHSVDRMLRLINQLLEFRKMQQGKLALTLREGDIVVHVQNIYMDFHEVAEEKEIYYNFKTQIRSLTMPFDMSYIDKIVYNLISNAFKYTKRGGEVQVEIKRTEQDELKIIVTDSGIGVPEHLQEHLFDRYMESNRVVKDSLGIGLTLTAELVRTHHGTISYEQRSDGTMGSVFIVTLPTLASAYSAEEFAPENVIRDTVEEEQLKGFEQVYREMRAQPLNENITVMVVEDDGDVASYIGEVLAPYFRIITASNGVDALQLLQDSPQKPQLIVSDVMMPEMDGFQLTAKLRKDEQWRHLPIILLTALTDQDKYIKGITQGADFYLPKPFSPSILIAHTLQLVNQRSRIMAASSSSSAKQTSGSAGTNQEEKPQVAISDIRDKNFQKQLDSLITKHLSDENLSVDTLTDGLGIGRTKLFEKMKALMNMTPRDYILQRRMEYAVELLKTGDLGIAEIAYKTGFGNPPYFTRVFKKYYGKTPSEYIKG